MTKTEKVFKARLVDLLRDAECTAREIRETESESVRSMWFGTIDTLQNVIRLADIYFME